MLPTPPVCVSSWWIVTRARPRLGWSGRYRPTVSSKRRRPASASWATATAVNIFSLQPRLKRVSIVHGGRRAPPRAGEQPAPSGRAAPPAGRDRPHGGKRVGGGAGVGVIAPRGEPI